MYTALSDTFGRICNDADVLAGRWIKVYWDSDEDCGEGYDPTFWPGIMQEKTCCSSSQQCNAPGATPPSIKCFGIKSSPSAGYCAGKTAAFSMCATSQARANERASKFADVRINTQFAERPYPSDWTLILLLGHYSPQAPSMRAIRLFTF